MNSDAIIRKEMIMSKIRSKLTFIFGTGDLEDVESIIDFYEQKVNQLETNRDEAIKYINENLHEVEDGCGIWWYQLYDYETPKELLAILERGKE